MTARLLVTTADERSWDPTRPLLFLGEWCRLFARRDTWTRLDHELHPYHWDDRDKYHRDYAYLETIYENRLASLAERLGAIHGVTKDLRYWRIIVGPWLRFFSDAVFDRCETVRTAAESGAAEGTRVLRYELADWAPEDFAGFYRQFTRDGWNHVVYAECIRERQMPHALVAEAVLPPSSAAVTGGRARTVARNILDLYAKAIPPRFNNVAIVSAYIPWAQLWKLQRAFGQLPYLFSPEVRAVPRGVDSGLRKALVGDGGKTQFERVLDRLIPRMIPKAYVESFGDLSSRAVNALPKTPKAIFTANAYQGDDAFKVWAANGVERGVPLVIEQHGGNYGIGRVNQTEDHQLRIADVFASWGWTSGRAPNVRPMPALKFAEARPVPDNSGDVLVCLASLPRYFYSHFSFPAGGQFLAYLEEQIRFAKAIAPELSNKLRFRLDSDVFGWDVKARLIDAGLGAAIDDVVVALEKRLDSCRICVSTYNATVFLETLATNFPTLAYFNPKMYEVRPEAAPMMDRLREVGIFHETPDSAAKQLNAIGNDVASWWREPRLQSARTDFCERYARTSPDWVSEWAALLTSVAGSRARVS